MAEKDEFKFPDEAEKVEAKVDDKIDFEVCLLYTSDAADE